MKRFGLVVVSDSSLGNVMRDGTAMQSDPATEKIGTQGGYLIMSVDRELVDGGIGRFSLLEGKSHKLKRAARSSYAAEVIAVGDAVDVRSSRSDRGDAERPRGKGPWTEVEWLADSYDSGNGFKGRP